MKLQNSFETLLETIFLVTLPLIFIFTIALPIYSISIVVYVLSFYFAFFTVVYFIYRITKR